MTNFSDREYLRYSRHIQLSAIGVDGQSKLKNARVLVVGCGGLGAPVSLYLAAAGVGSITLVDGDTVELTNLQRQISFSEQQIGKPKANSTKRRLVELNSDISVAARDHHLTAENAVQLIEDVDLVFDCSDNLPTRYLINDCCKALSKPWIYASVFQFSGQCAVFNPEESCFRCLYPGTPTQAIDCNTAGILGALPGILGTIQASEGLKILLGLGSSLSGKLLLVESDNFSTHSIQRQTNKECYCCADSFTFDSANCEYPQTETSTHSAPPDTDQAKNMPSQTIDASDFHRFASRDDVVVVDVRNNDEREAFHLGGIHIPLSDLPDSKQLPVEKILVLYCQSGARSKEGAERLSKKGYTAHSVDGGLIEILKHST